MSAIPQLSACPYPDNFQTNAQQAFQELGGIELGDLRSNRRLVSVYARMLNAPGKSIPQCTQNKAEAKAFYRLLDDPMLTDELLLEQHRSSVLRRASASTCPVFLAIQDTTSCNYDTHKSLTGLGSISSNQERTDFAGLFIHSTLLSAADEDQIFGLLGAKIYTRDTSQTKARKPGERNRQLIDDKESIRWLESLALTCRAQTELQAALQAKQQQQQQQPSPTEPPPPTPQIINVGDREADIYELLLEAQEHRASGIGLLVRSQHNRSLVAEEQLMWAKLQSSPSLGRVQIKLPRSQGNKARSATLAVRVQSVRIAVPRHKAKYQHMSTPIAATIIELREESSATTPSIHWRLLTTLEVPDLATALRLGRWYAKRWQIEEFHRILKTGCQVESRQMRSLERLKPIIALDMMVACNLMSISAAARQQPESPASHWLDEDEIDAIQAYQSRGQQPAQNQSPLSISAAVKFIAQQGGHLGRNSDGPPGAQVLWQGMLQLRAITAAWHAFGPRNTCG